MSKKKDILNNEIINMAESDFASSFLSTFSASLIMLFASVAITYFAMESGLLNPLTEIIHNIMVGLARESGDFQAIIIVAGRDGWEIAEMFAGAATFFISVSVIGAILGLEERQNEAIYL